ncbi:hypothetical protein [Paenibacillus puerhi]|uniref:hypothetical protein n=1 Tax=Paenibacillus puerhi TaxID=2692622 RepID=UPI00135CE84E|nr:hypothetical protein [Paenibacillus puerhi]
MNDRNNPDADKPLSVLESKPERQTRSSEELLYAPEYEALAPLREFVDNLIDSIQQARDESRD